MVIYVIISILFILYFIPISMISVSKRLLIQSELSDEEIYEEVKGEVEILNFTDEIDVNVKITDEAIGSCCKKESKNKYLIEIADNFLGRTYGTIKHEVYHIYKDDCEYGDLPIFSFRTLKYLFLQEPRANIYDTFNIRV